MTPQLHRANAGFVLVLTLWVIVVLALAAGAFADRVASALDKAQQSRQNTQALIAMESARAEVLYRLGTTTLTEYGLGRGGTAIALDDRPYRLGDQGSNNASTVRLQDTRGLLNLNLGDDAQVNRLLGLLGVAPEQRSRMIGHLRDYTRASGGHRLNGADEQDYKARGLPTPTHRDLVSPWQAKRVFGWADAAALWENDRLVKLTTTTQTMGLNPNTAPADVLATLPGVTAEMAQVLVSRRQLAPFTHEGDVTALTGIPLNMPPGMGIVAIPSRVLRVTQWAPGMPWAVQYHLRLTPIDVAEPWRIEYFSQVPAPAEADPLSTAFQFPGRTSTTPDLLPSFLQGR